MLMAMDDDFIRRLLILLARRLTEKLSTMETKWFTEIFGALQLLLLLWTLLKSSQICCNVIWRKIMTISFRIDWKPNYFGSDSNNFDSPTMETLVPQTINSNPEQNLTLKNESTIENWLTNFSWAKTKLKTGFLTFEEWKHHWKLPF